MSLMCHYYDTIDKFGKGYNRYSTCPYLYGLPWLKVIFDKLRYILPGWGTLSTSIKLRYYQAKHPDIQVEMAS